MTALSDPLLVNHQERLQRDISGGPKPARYCTTTSLGTALSLCPSTYFFKAVKCFSSLGSVVLTPLDLDRKTTAMLKYLMRWNYKRQVNRAFSGQWLRLFHSLLILSWFSWIHCQQRISDDSSIQRVNHRVGFKKKRSKKKKRKGKKKNPQVLDEILRYCWSS